MLALPAIRALILRNSKKATMKEGPEVNVSRLDIHSRLFLTVEVGRIGVEGATVDADYRFAGLGRQ